MVFWVVLKAYFATKMPFIALAGHMTYNIGATKTGSY